MGLTRLLARAEVSHDALIDFPSEKAFKASDDVPFRPSIRPASDDIVDRRLVIAHTDHDGSMTPERGYERPDGPAGPHRQASTRSPTNAAKGRMSCFTLADSRALM